MNSAQDSSLGREVAYPSRYDASLLFPIPRAGARSELGLDPATLPFVGFDRWQAFELAWLDVRGKPQVDTATLRVPCDSPNLIESKSLKLYFNSLNDERFADRNALRERVVADLSAAAGAPVAMAFGVPAISAEAGESIDALDIDIDHYDPPRPEFLAADAGDIVEETLLSHLLKSNCPVTGQPDWASVSIAYRGPRIDRAGLLRYVCSFRHHAGFHEQCVERIFVDVLARCRPRSLSVEARYTRRGGLDINPWRATPGAPEPRARRETRQ